MAYPPITALPTAPSRARPSTFATEADAFLAALATFRTETNALADYMENTSAADAETSATNAATSETNAQNWAVKTDGIVESTDYSSKAWAVGGTGVTDTSSAGAAKEWATKAEDSTVDGSGFSALHHAAKSSASATAAANSATAAANSAGSIASGAWSSGSSYSVGTVVYSPITYLSYRAITTHSGETTDPSSDNTNWVELGGATTLTDLGITATAAELNILDGATVTTAEINLLDGATVTTAEINYLDITTLGTTEASKAVTADSNGVVTFDNGISEEYNAVTSSSNATTVNLRDGTNFSHTLTENTTFTFSNPASSGKVSMFSLKIVQDSSASGYTVTWPSSVDWPSATAPTLTATASAVDYFIFITHDGGTTYYGFTAGQALG